MILKNERRFQWYDVLYVSVHEVLRQFKHFEFISVSKLGSSKCQGNKPIKTVTATFQFASEHLQRDSLSLSFTHSFALCLSSCPFPPTVINTHMLHKELLVSLMAGSKWRLIFPGLYLYSIANDFLGGLLIPRSLVYE